MKTKKALLDLTKIRNFFLLIYLYFIAFNVDKLKTKGLKQKYAKIYNKKLREDLMSSLNRLEESAVILYKNNLFFPESKRELESFIYYASIMNDIELAEKLAKEYSSKYYLPSLIINCRKEGWSRVIDCLAKDPINSGQLFLYLLETDSTEKIVDLFKLKPVFDKNIIKNALAYRKDLRRRMLSVLKNKNCPFKIRAQLAEHFPELRKNLYDFKKRHIV